MTEGPGEAHQLIRRLISKWHTHALYDQTSHHASTPNEWGCCVNRQARVALGDRIRNSLQLTALRLKPSRLLGVQALTLHYP